MHWGKGKLRRCCPQILAPLCCAFPCAILLYNSEWHAQHEWHKVWIESIVRLFHFCAMYLICSSNAAVCAEWLLRLDPQTECKQHRINAPFSDMFLITHRSISMDIKKDIWLGLHRYHYWGRVCSMHFVKCSASKLVGFCSWEFPVHCSFSSA